MFGVVWEKGYKSLHAKGLNPIVVVRSALLRILCWSFKTVSCATPRLVCPILHYLIISVYSLIIPLSLISIIPKTLSTPITITHSYITYKGSKSRSSPSSKWLSFHSKFTCQPIVFIVIFPHSLSLHMWHIWYWKTNSCFTTYISA